MTVQAIRGVGFCARMTRTGDWAFNYALDLAAEQDVRLDIFFFPTPPTRPHASRGRHGELAEYSEQKKIELERDVRLYYDTILGDFVNAGFRLCEGDEDPELRRCLLVRKEYDVLVLAYEGFHCKFGTRSIEAFAESLPCPTVLVGPERHDQYFLNTPATVWVSKLGLEHVEHHHVNEVTVSVPGTD